MLKIDESSRQHICLNIYKKHSIMDWLIDQFSIEIFLTLVLGVILFNVWKSSSKAKYPPGPIGLPLAGYLPFISKDPHLKFQKLAKKYGDIFSIRLGFKTVVVLNSADAIREVVNKAELLGRPENSIFSRAIQTPFFMNGQVWQDHRRFVLHALRDLGLGKSKMHLLIKEEINELLKMIEKESGRPCDARRLLTPSMSNNICSLIFGKRYDYDDPERIQLDDILNTISRSASLTSALLFFPFISKLSFVQKYFNFDKIMVASGKFRALLMKKIQDRKETLDGNNPNDLIESYLNELETKQENSPVKTLSELYLIGVVQNLFGAGSETVRTAVGWSLFSMAAYPEVQNKVQAEMDRVIGTERTPLFEDMKDLPYIQAVLMELMRWRTVAPISPTREVLQDVGIKDYYLPKGTLVIPNLWAAHHDEKCWKQPDDFVPERFLSTDGKSTIKSSNYIPFSFGKRNCPGESLATVEIFLYFTTILQKFSITLPSGVKPDLEGTLAIAYAPKPHKLCFTTRI